MSGFHQSTERVRVRKREEEGEREKVKMKEREREKGRKTVELFFLLKTLSHKN